MGGKCCKRMSRSPVSLTPSNSNLSSTLELDDKEVSLLSLTWRKDDFGWLYEIGISIYAHVFQLAPELKVFFPYVVECERNGKPWSDSKGFRTQALRFVQIISNAVEKAESKIPDEQSALHKRLYNLGEFHQRFALNGFKPTHWHGFCIAVRNAMREQCLNMPGLSAQERERASAAWEKLSRYIIGRMEDGYFGRKR